MKDIKKYPSLIKFFTGGIGIEEFISNSNPIDIRRVIDNLESLIEDSKSVYYKSKKSLVFFLSLILGYVYLIPKLILVVKPTVWFWLILSLVSLCFLSSIYNFVKSWKFVREMKVLKKTIQYKWNGVNKFESDDFEFNTKRKVFK